MMLTSIRDFLDKKKGLVLAGVALLALSIWLLFPALPDQDKLQDLLERGNYQAVREGAAQVLTREPEAHSIRELSVRASLAEGRYAEAMEQMLFLAGSDRDISHLQYLFNGALSSIIEDQGEGSDLLALLAAELDKFPDWDWLKEYGLKVLTQGEVVSWTPSYLANFSIEDIKEYPVLVDTAWGRVAESQDWDAAWRTAEILDNLVVANFESDLPWETVVIVGSQREETVLIERRSNVMPGFTHRASLVLSRFGLDEEKWAVLQSTYPEDPLLAIGRGRLGLDWLVEWESNNTVDAEYASTYSSLKAQLIAQASRVETQHFANITRWHLLGGALRDARNKDKLSIVLDYLSMYPDMSEDIHTARLALDPPEPAWVLNGMAGASLINAGNGLLRMELDPEDPYGPNTYIYYNLVTREEFILPQGNFYWSPDGFHVAIDAWYDDGTIQIYSNRGELVAEFPGDNNVDLHGWRDSDTLWLGKMELEYLVGNVHRLYIFDIADGSTRRVDSVADPQYNNFWYGPKGRVAWSDGQEFTVYDGKMTSLTHQANYIRVQSWAPDGRSLILELDGKPYYYPVGGRLQKLDLPSTHYSSCTSWLNSEEITWAFPICDQTMLGIYNLETGQVTMTGIVNPVSVAGNRVMVTHLDEQYIYELD